MQKSNQNILRATVRHTISLLLGSMSVYLGSSMVIYTPTVWLDSDRKHTCTHTEWWKDMTSAATDNQRCKGASFPKLFQRTQNGNQNSCASFSRPEKKKKEEKNREKKSWGLEPQLTVNKPPPLMQLQTKKKKKTVVCSLYFLST